MTKYKRLEMPYYLIQSYADLAIAHKRNVDRNPNDVYVGFRHNFALLSINAAIVEGTLRSILHWYLFEEAEKATKKGLKLGQTGPDLAERTLIRLRLDVDTSDTWSKLKSNFKYLHAKSLSDVVTQSVLKKIEHLFTIRNRTAHGSSIQIPSEQVALEDDEYLFALQEKLLDLTRFLSGELGTSDIYDGLGHKDVASVFWLTTKDFVTKLEALAPFAEELQKNIEAIKNYEFGKLFMG